MSKISQNIFRQALCVLLFSDNINAFPNDLKLTQFPTGFLVLAVQKLVILTWIFVKVERNFNCKLGNLSSEILSGSIVVLVSGVLKRTAVHRNTETETLGKTCIYFHMRLRSG